MFLAVRQTVRGAATRFTQFDTCFLIRELHRFSRSYINIIYLLLLLLLVLLLGVLKAEVQLLLDIFFVGVGVLNKDVDVVNDFDLAGVEKENCDPAPAPAPALAFGAGAGADADADFRCKSCCFEGRPK